MVDKEWRRPRGPPGLCQNGCLIPVGFMIYYKKEVSCYERHYHERVGKDDSRAAA